MFAEEVYGMLSSLWAVHAKPPKCLQNLTCYIDCLLWSLSKGSFGKGQTLLKRLYEKREYTRVTLKKSVEDRKGFLAEGHETTWLEDFTTLDHITKVNLEEA